MKKYIPTVCIVFLFCLIISFIAQRAIFINVPYSDPNIGQPILQDKLKITAVTFDSTINNHGLEVIQDADMHTIVSWLRQFTVGQPLPKEAPLKPGSGSIQVIVTYENGSTQNIAIDYIQIGTRYYHIDRPDPPDVIPPLD